MFHHVYSPIKHQLNYSTISTPQFHIRAIISPFLLPHSAIYIPPAPPCYNFSSVSQYRNREETPKFPHYKYQFVRQEDFSLQSNRSCWGQNMNISDLTSPAVGGQNMNISDITPAVGGQDMNIPGLTSAAVGGQDMTIPDLTSAAGVGK